MRRFWACWLVIAVLAGPVPKVAAAPRDAASLFREYRADLEDRFTNSIGMEFLYLKPGTFPMGSADPQASPDELPVHEVRIDKGFYLGVFEVTQAQWVAVMGENNSFFQDPTRPVEKVAWLETREFLRRLNEREHTDRYSLPTEAEWEYACRAGNHTPFAWGEAPDDRFAWSRSNSESQSHPVGSRLPNAWGLHDMAGNVSEWCEEVYALYPGSTMEPPAEDDQPTRVTRGGSWASRAEDLRSANRSRLWQHFRMSVTGFRVKARSEEAPAR